MRRKNPIKRRTQLKKITNKQRARIRKYAPINKKFKEDNPLCIIKVEGCEVYTTDWHHPEGKVGERLFDVSKAIACCRNCHNWAESHPAEAKEIGVSAHRL